MGAAGASGIGGSNFGYAKEAVIPASQGSPKCDGSLAVFRLEEKWHAIVLYAIRSACAPMRVS